MRVPIIISLLLIPLLTFSQKLKPTRAGNLPSVIRESSGLAEADSNFFWTMNDDRNAPVIYLINHLGGNISSFKDSVLSNHDWEDLAENSSQFFIGDFGNNNQRRRSLLIYILNRRRKEINSPIEKITFHYPDQKQFPPPPLNWNFDCEAFFYHKDSLYLLSKNLSTPNDGYSKMYRLPAQPGDYAAELIDSFYLNEPVTSADISPDGKTIVVLTYFSLWVFKDFNGSNFFRGKVFQFPFRGLTQKEAICFVNDHELFMTDERHFGKGGKLYKIVLDQLDFSQPPSKYKKQLLKKMIYNAFNNPKAKYNKIRKREASQ